MAERFKLPQELFENVWNYFDKQSRGSVHVSAIVKELSTYEGE
jgi:hypothetical protein